MTVEASSHFCGLISSTKLSCHVIVKLSSMKTNRQCSASRFCTQTSHSKVHYGNKRC